MSQDLKIQTNNLPVKLGDLTKFVLVGREKLNAVKAEINAILILGLASGVMQQKQEEAQMLAEALLLAEAKIGELTDKIPTKAGKRTDLPQPTDSSVGKLTKKETLEKLGLKEKQVERFEALAKHPEVVAKVIAESKETENLPTRIEVLKQIKIEKQKEKIQHPLADNPEEGMSTEQIVRRKLSNCVKNLSKESLIIGDSDKIIDLILGVIKEFIDE